MAAYDIDPPGSGANAYVGPGPAWYPVRPGGVDAVAERADRTLLLVWPTWQATWAADAVAAYHAAGGRTVVYVGEGPGGRTGDASLHARLGIHGPCEPCALGVVDAPCVCGIEQLWELHRSIAIPRWGGADDSCGLYLRAARTPATDRRRRRRVMGLRPPRGTA